MARDSRLPVRLLRAIERSGLSQKEVAARVGVSPASVTRWVLGSRTPTLANLSNLAGVLKVDMGALLAGIRVAA